MTSGGPGAMRRGVMVFVAGSVFFALLAVLWALASPLFSVPDEYAHIARAIGLVHGQLLGHSVAGGQYPAFDLPKADAYPSSVQCFVRQPNVAADCAGHLGARDGATSVQSWVAGYNPIYYAAVGLPSLFLGGAPAVYAMRIVSALLSAVFFGWAVQCALASRQRRWMPAALAFGTAPMLLFLSGAVNPNGLEALSALALWIAVPRLVEAHVTAPEQVGEAAEAAHAGARLSRSYLWVVVLVSGAMLANARSLGPLWVLIVVALALWVGGWRGTKALFTTARSYAWIGALALLGVFSVAWTAWTGSLSGQASPGSVPYAGASFLRGVAVMVHETPNYVHQALGVFGWLDTDLPQYAYWAPVAALGSLVLLALSASGRRGRLTLAVVVVLAVLVPIVVQAASIGSTGLIWQGRYGLFLYVGIPVVAALALSDRPQPGAIDDRHAPLRFTALTALLLWAFGVLAFFFALRRYVVGTGTPVTAMLHHAQWQPPLGWLPLTLAFCVVYAAVLFWLTWLARPQARPLPAA